jgi:arginase family enzyme
VSALRGLCPDCGTRTAVAVDDTFECHVCGREFAAGIVRVPRAWGSGGEGMAAAASLELPYPEVATIAQDTLAAQTEALAAALPGRTIVVGGCCCSHTGTIVGLSRRLGRLGIVWLDAHGDLNTPETSPSGNEWGMPLRAAIHAGAVKPADVALVGARNLDPPEQDYMASVGIDDDVERALAGVAAVYVAFDADVLDPAVVQCFMPEPDGLSVGEAVAIVESAVARRPLAGIGITGLVPDPANAAVAEQLLAAAGLPGSWPGGERASV